MIITSNPLILEAFAPYGQVLMGQGEGPERHNFAARIANLRLNATPNMTFMRVPVSAMPVYVEELERHLYSSQTFIPLKHTRQLVAVCPSLHDGKPDIKNLLAFVAEGGQAVNYNPGIWHAPRTAIGGSGEFIMFRFDEGNREDTERYPLDSPLRIE